MLKHVTVFGNVTGSDKERWVKIRDCHRKALQRRRTKSGQAAKKIKPPRYEKELAFLVPYLVDDDQRTSNFAPSVNSTEDKAGGIDENEEEVLNDTEDSYPASLSTSPLLVNTTKSVPLNTSSTLSPGNVKPLMYKKRNRNGGQPKTAATVLQEYLNNISERPKTVEVADSLTTFFFQSMEKTVRGFPLRDQIEMKKKIFQLVSDREMDLVYRPTPEPVEQSFITPQSSSSAATPEERLLGIFDNVSLQTENLITTPKTNLAWRGGSVLMRAPYLKISSLGPGHDTSGERRASPERRGWSRYKRRECCNMPSSEDLVHLLLLSENSMLKRRVVRGCKRGIKRWGVHPINRRRRAHGEYHHLMKQLKEKPERFFQYTRMSVPTFDFILNRLKSRLEKKRIG
ncbi:hypothetical protein J6590_100150 [Homalodisca vitripennis]|nr:hypothetical protein J6590_100150 [Homalodisca vitripennis]